MTFHGLVNIGPFCALLCVKGAFHGCCCGCSHATSMELDAFPDLQHFVKVVMRQNPTPSQGRRSNGATRRNYFISPRFFLFICVLHSAAHVERKMPLIIVLCRKVSLSAQKQSSLQCRHPWKMTQGCLRWHMAASCVPVRGKHREASYCC